MAIKTTPSASQQLLPIRLSPAPPGLWRARDRGDKGRSYISALTRLIKKQNTCSFCGFKSSIPENSDYSGADLEIYCEDGYDDNLADDNIHLSCHFCRMCFNLEYAGECGAILAYVPEFSQAFVNNIIRSGMYLQHFHEMLGAYISQPAGAADNPAELAKRNNTLASSTATFKDINEWVDSVGVLTAAFKNRAIAAEKIINTSRPEILGAAMAAIAKIRDQDTHDDTLYATSSLNDELRQIFSEELEKNKYKMVDPSETPPPPPDLDSLLHGIRVIPTKPGCDPAKSWGVKSHYTLRSPLQWRHSFKMLMDSFAAEGMMPSLPLTNIVKIAKELETAAEQEANSNE